MDNLLVNLLEIIKYVLPALVVYFTIQSLLKTWLAGIKMPIQGLSQSPQTISTPKAQPSEALIQVVLQAHERLVLLLERLSAENILQRNMQPGLTVFELQALMLQQIRAEYEHNMAQQLYIAPQTWETIKQAKQLLQQLVQEQARILPPDAPAIELAKAILQNQSLVQNLIEQGILQLKKGVVGYFEA